MFSKYKNTLSILLLFTVISFLLFTSCSSGKTQGFSIYLKDSGEMVLEDNQIAAFHPDNNTFQLNDSGVAKWNSFQTYPDIPKLAQSLFGKDFIIKISGKQICEGKFWSGLSSASVDSVVILESIYKLDNTKNLIYIMNSYPGSARNSSNEYLQTQLTEYFMSINKIN
jgi:hypothetical protein